MKTLMTTVLLSAMSVSIASINTAFAISAEEQGLAIAKKVEQRDSGWNDYTTSLKMTLVNKQGDKSTRAIRLKILEMSGDGDKSLTIFDSPRDIKGTAFLSYSHAVTPDDQWLYLPALKRVKRISSSNKSGPFMGSQFAYEDLASFEVDKYQYKFLREETLNGKNTWVVENQPIYKHSGYTRQIVWIDKERYIPLKIEFYDRKNTLLKVLQFQNYTLYLGQYWRAHEQVMENQQNGKVTTLSLNNFKFRTGLNQRSFDKNALKRAR